MVKNLFVKDKKAKQLWLITVRHDLEFKLTSLGNVSFMFAGYYIMIIDIITRNDFDQTVMNKICET